MQYTHIPVVSCFYADQTIESPADAEAHFEYEMILVTGGRATVTINHQTYPLHPGSLLFISRLERHEFTLEEEPYMRYVATMSGDLLLSNVKDTELLSIFLQRPQHFCPVISLSEEAYEILLPLFSRMVDEYTRQQPYYISRSASLVVAILIELFRTHPEAFPNQSHTNTSVAVLNAQRYINDHFHEKINLQEIADQNYMNRHTLSLAFKDIVGIPFKEYLILFRIAEAKKLLLTTSLSIEEIAGQVGYPNVNNFIRIFKSKEAVTPHKYRMHAAS